MEIRGCKPFQAVFVGAEKSLLRAGLPLLGVAWPAVSKWQWRGLTTAGRDSFLLRASLRTRSQPLDVRYRFQLASLLRWSTRKLSPWVSLHTISAISLESHSPLHPPSVLPLFTNTRAVCFSNHRRQQPCWLSDNWPLKTQPTLGNGEHCSELMSFPSQVGPPWLCGTGVQTWFYCF